jgi:hypothetical protein
LDEERLQACLAAQLEELEEYRYSGAKLRSLYANQGSLWKEK